MKICDNDEFMPMLYNFSAVYKAVRLLDKKLDQHNTGQEALSEEAYQEELDNLKQAIEKTILYLSHAIEIACKGTKDSQEFKNWLRWQQTEIENIVLQIQQRIFKYKLEIPDAQILNTKLHDIYKALVPNTDFTSLYIEYCHMRRYIKNKGYKQTRPDVREHFINHFSSLVVSVVFNNHYKWYIKHKSELDRDCAFICTELKRGGLQDRSIDIVKLFSNVEDAMEDDECSQVVQEQEIKEKLKYLAYLKKRTFLQMSRDLIRDVLDHLSAKLQMATNAAKDLVGSAFHAVRHPVDTCTGLVKLIRHPVSAFELSWERAKARPWSTAITITFDVSLFLGAFFSPFVLPIVVVFELLQFTDIGGRLGVLAEDYELAKVQRETLAIERSKQEREVEGEYLDEIESIEIDHAEKLRRLKVLKKFEEDEAKRREDEQERKRVLQGVEDSLPSDLPAGQIKDLMDKISKEALSIREKMSKEDLKEKKRAKERQDLLEMRAEHEKIKEDRMALLRKFSSKFKLSKKKAAKSLYSGTSFFPDISRNLDEWYSDDTMNFLLHNYLGNRQDVMIMAGIDLMQHGGETLEENLSQREEHIAAYEEEIKLSVPTIILPINFGSRHWVALYIHHDFHGHERSTPAIGYFDPLGDDMPKSLHDLLTKRYSTNPEDYLVSPIKLQKDAYNCGPWVVEILRELVEHEHLPAEDFNINSARARHLEFLETSHSSHAPPSPDRRRAERHGELMQPEHDGSAILKPS